MVAVLFVVRPGWALTPDEIVLIANKNEPESVRLAEYYAAKRGIPAGRLLKLDVPNHEQMPFADYQAKVADPVRTFLRTGGLETKIKCLVTFYGVPFRIAAKVSTKGETDELAELKQMLPGANEKLREGVLAVEQELKDLNPSFVPADKGMTIDDLARRADDAMRRIEQRIQALPTPASRVQPLKLYAQNLERLGGTAAVVRRFAAAQIADPNQKPEEKRKWIDLRDRVKKAEQEVEALSSASSDASARGRLRKLVSDNFGLFTYVRLLQRQIESLDADQTVSALDSELALLWWGDHYPRARWQPNVLHYGVHANTPPVLMTCRLDGPTPAVVRDIILNSLKAEQAGLQGRVALDSRGIAPVEANGTSSGYGQYDQTIRDLAHFVQTKTKLPLTWDDTAALFAPHSVKDVALYCGWYSVRRYVPCCQFNVGAVGFHVASFEMVSLRGEHEQGWVKGLLQDGVVATIGPVAEPYLAAFPRADDFFPLLMTGKLPLAEVYWKTTPMTSWMMACVGDPLYTPYKRNPAVKVVDLPARLQSIFHPPTTQPAASAPAR